MILKKKKMDPRSPSAFKMLFFLKISFKQQRKQTKMHSKAHTPFDSFDKFHEQKSCQFAVLPVCMQ